MCLTKCADPTEPGVYWRDNHGWVRYSPSIEQAVRAKKVTTLALGKIGTATYNIDLQRMQQVNLTTGNRREVKIVENRTSTFLTSNFRTLFPTKKPKNEDCVEDFLKKLIEEEFLRAVISKNFACVTNIKANNFLSKDDGIQCKFMQALQSAAAKNRNILDGMRAAVETLDTSRLHSLHYVFHGTKPPNLIPILQMGLDSTKSRGCSFWVGQTPDVSRHYSNPAKRMVLLLQLENNGETPWNSGARCIPSNKPEVLLPVGYVDVN